MVYLIHFHAPLGNTSNPRAMARHYIGYAANLDARIQQHRAGGGARIMAAVVQSGIDWEVARVWEGDGHVERTIKNHKRAARFCPICNPERAYTPLRSRHATSD